MQDTSGCFSVTAAGTDSGATATKAAVTRRAYFVTSISGHTDTDSVLQILDGTTVAWEGKIDISVEGWQFGYFFPTPIVCTAGNLAAGKVVTSTSDCQVTITGFQVP